VNHLQRNFNQIYQQVLWQLRCLKRLNFDSRIDFHLSCFSFADFAVELMEGLIYQLNHRQLCQLKFWHCSLFVYFVSKHSVYFSSQGFIVTEPHSNCLSLTHFDSFLDSSAAKFFRQLTNRLKVNNLNKLYKCQLNCFKDCVFTYLLSDVVATG